MQAMNMLHAAGLKPAQILKLDALGFWSAPASKGHHLARPGGLVEHSVNVTARLVELTDSWSVPWPRPESPYLVGMLHDLVKTRCYQLDERKTEDGGRAAYRWAETGLPGHGLASCDIAWNALGVTLLPEEHAAVAFHMGRFGVGREYSEQTFSDALGEWGMYIIAAHAADWYSSEVDEARWADEDGNGGRDGGKN